MYNCAMGYFTSIFVGVEMAQMLKAQVLYVYVQGDYVPVEFDPPWIKTNIYLSISGHVLGALICSVLVWIEYFRQKYTFLSCANSI